MIPKMTRIINYCLNTNKSYFQGCSGEYCLNIVKNELKSSMPTRHARLEGYKIITLVICFQKLRI